MEHSFFSKKLLRPFALLFIIFISVCNSVFGQATVYTFNYTGGTQNWTVPPCVTSITVTLKGGKGGGTSGGNGATVSGVMTVTPGQVLQVKVGGQGLCPGGATYGGGGSAPNSSIAGYAGCTGGGASSILVAPYTNASAVAVAAGGGGKGGGDMGGAGGAGGCANGLNGNSPFGIGGGGASQTAGGAGGPPWTAGGGTGGTGTQMQGGSGGVDINYGTAPGGGGGGGWYGGGGGGSDNISGTSAIGGGGGGGGSSKTPTGWNCASGNNAGPGQVTISALVVTPTLAVNSPTMCAGLSAVLTATGGTTYTWQPGGMTGNPVTVSPAATTIYTVSTGAGACIATKTAVVTVYALPTPTATSNSPVCVNKPINFTGTGGTTYTWTGPGGYSSTSQNPVIAAAQPTNAGTYTLTVKNANGCVKTTTVTVVVNPLPVITVPNPTLCANQTLNLSATGGTAYAWTGPNSFSSSSQNPTIPNASTLMTGAYNVTVTSSFGCTNTAVSNVTVFTLPIPTISSNTPCVGSTLSLTGSGGGTYSWTGPNGFSSTAQNPSVGNVTSAAGGTYSLVVTMGSCSNSTTSPVTINALPAPTAISNSPVCLNKPINFTGSGGTTYTWTGPGAFSSNSQNPVIATAQSTNAGTYTLGVTNANGCVNYTTTTVVVNPLPVIIVTNPTVCANQSINLSATGGTAYAWTGPNSFSSSSQNPSITNASTVMTGAYNVTVTSSFGCTNTAVSNVTVYPLPVPAITSNSPCAGATLSFTGSGGTSYSWTGPNAFSSTAQNPSISNVSLAANGIYTLVATVGSCTSSVTQSVTVYALPSPTATSNSPICLNQNINLNGTGATTYTWTGPGSFSSTSQNPVIAVAQSSNSGTYTLTVTNANGCTNFATTNVVVNPLPVITVNNPTVCLNQNTTLSATGGTAYVWSGPNSFSSSSQNPSITNASMAMNGAYNVTVTSAQGCTASATATLTVITLPVASITSNTPCVGSTLNLNGSGGASFTWTGPNSFSSSLQNPTISNVSLAANGIYTLIVTAGTCSNSTTQSITVNALPTPTATNNSPICENQTLNLSGTGGTTYTWTGPGSFNSTLQNPVIAVAQPSNSGTYTLTVTNVNGCVNFTTTTVVVNPLPVITVSNPTVCLNQNTNLSATGGTAYAWSGPNSFSSSSQNPSITNASMSMNGTYTVIVTSAQGCTASTTSGLTVITLPVASITSNTPCVGSTLTFTGSGGSTFSWAGPNGFSSTAQFPTIPNVGLTANGIYTLIITAGTCSNSTTQSVTVNALPTPTASNNTPICDGQTINLLGSSASSYTWSGPASFGSNVQNPSITTASTTSSGTFTLTVTDANGCVNFATTNVTVNPIPVPQIGSNSPVCLNNTINLTSGGGTSYAWSGPNSFSSGLQNPTIPGATPVNDGVYTVTVTALGCSNTTTVNVSVLTPTIAASNTGPYCSGVTIQLNTSSVSGYTWTGPGGFASNSQNPTIGASTTAMSGVYNLLASIGSCTAAASTTVVVNALPTPTASNNTPICDGQTINLLGSSASSYTWSGPASFGSNVQNPSITTASTTSSGTFTLTVTDANGCVNFATTNVTVNPIPVPQIGSNSPVCLNNSINLTSGGGTSYAWSGPNSFSSGLQNPTIPGATPVNDGVYTVTVTALGCSNTTTVNVSVLTPTIAASNTGPYCSGATIQLNTSSVSGYTWTGPGGFASNSQNPTIGASTTAMSGVYNLLASIGSCTAAASTSVTVNPLPSPLIISNSPVCEGATITMAGTGGTTYLWSGPAGFGGAVQSSSVPSANSSNAGMYTLTVTDANNCINSTTYSVTVNPLPNAVAVGTTVCQNANAILTASGGNTYSWSGPNSFSAIGSSATIPSAPLNSSGQYTVTATSVFGCTNTAVTSLNVIAAPTPSIQSNSPVCINGSINLTTQPGYNYAWTGPGGFISSVQSPSLNATTTALSGNYYLTMTDANNCSASTNVNVVVNPLPVPVISSNTRIGCAPLCVNFNVSTATQVNSATWTLGNGSAGSGSTVSACYNAQGVHTVNASVTDGNGCFNSATYTVQVTPQPVADFNFSPLKPIINQDADVTFTDASHGTNITSWNWYFANTAAFQSAEQNTHFLFQDPGTYVVALVVKNEFGCTDTILKPITVSEDFGIYVPNAFTPNGDGINDTFQPKGFGIEKYEMQIYDRWGEKVFETTEFEKGWDGNYISRGELISKDDTYTWRIKATSVFGKAHEYTGHVTLIK